MSLLNPRLAERGPHLPIRKNTYPRLANRPHNGPVPLDTRAPTGGDLKAERGAVSWRLPRKRRLEVRCPPAGESRPRTSHGAATGRGPDRRNAREGATGSERDGRVPRRGAARPRSGAGRYRKSRGGRRQAPFFGLPERRLHAPAIPRPGRGTRKATSPTPAGKGAGMHGCVPIDAVRCVIAKPLPAG